MRESPDDFGFCPFCGAPLQAAQPLQVRKFVSVLSATCLMFQAIKPLGLLLARLPVGPEHLGLAAGANFQLPTGPASGSRTAARPGSASLSDSTSWPPSLTVEGRQVTAAVSGALRRTGSNLMVHVEPV
jgi:hypothetical protein